MMTHPRTTTLMRACTALLAVASLLVGAAAPHAKAAGPTAADQNETTIYRGLIVSMGNVATGRNTSLNMNITGWTSPTQRQVMLNALMEGTGEQGLFDVMRRQPERGFLQIRNEPGTIRLKYAWESVADDGSREITLIADNLLPIFVTQGNQRLSENQYTIVYLEVDADGNGTGQVAGAASITWDAEAERIKIGIESTEPIRMTSVRKVQ